MQPLGRKNYGSIPHLSTSKLGPIDRYITPGQEKILVEKKRDKHDLIIVTEKYDGSNVGVAKIEGQIVALTRAGYEAKTSTYDHHKDFALFVDQNVAEFRFLGERERMVGEWLGTPHGINYTYHNNSPFMVFDIFTDTNERYPFKHLAEIVPTENLVRVLYEGDSVAPEKLLPYLNLRTAWMSSVESPEGMVYRVERRGKVDFLAKWVRHDFEPGKYLNK